MEADSRDKDENARHEEDTLLVEDQENKIQKHSQKGTPLCLQMTENKKLEVL